MQGGAGGWNVETRESFCLRNPARGVERALKKVSPAPRDRWAVMG